MSNNVPTTPQTHDSNQNKLVQWVSSVVNVETKSKSNLDYLNSVLGPLKNDINIYKQEFQEKPIETQVEELSIQEAKNDLENDNQLQGSFTHEIVFKIEEDVFIEKVNIYEKICPGSSLLKIEALEKTNPDVWFTLWETVDPQEQIRKAQIFTPEIKSSPFKTNTIRLTICGSLYLIDGVEIQGSKLAVESEKPQIANISLLSTHLKNLTLSDLFADVYFEVEGKIIPAHRNILVCRSEYFRAMLSTHGHFKESFVSVKPAENPIYVKDIQYRIFTEVLSYLYTGHLSSPEVGFSVLIGVMRAADKMNLVDLQKHCLFELSQIINADNLVKIYQEASETPDVLKDVIQVCFMEASINFSYISRTEDFCSLGQEQMLKMIENVVPKLNRLTSLQVNGEHVNPTPTPAPNPIPEDNNTSSDSDDE